MGPIILASILAAGAPPPEPMPVEEAVRALGDRDWRRREEAERTLLRAGERAIGALERAARAGDREVALRARSLLDRIDPEEAAFRILRLEPPDAPGRPFRIAGFAVLHGRRGEDARGVETPRDGLRPSSFTIRFRIARVGGLWVEIEERVPGATLPLLSGSVRGGDLRVLKRACLSEWLLLPPDPRGWERRFLVTVQCRSGRRSRLRQSAWPHPASPAFLDALTATVLRQLRSEDEAARDEAAEIAAFLGLRQALGILTSLRSEEALLARASLGDEEARDRLHAIADSGDADPTLRFRAALTLAEAGEAVGPRALVRMLGGQDAYHLHRALLRITRAVDDAAVLEALDELLTGPWSGKAPWEDPATEALYLAWARTRGAPETLPLLVGILKRSAGQGAAARAEGILRILPSLLAEARPSWELVDALLEIIPPFLRGGTLRPAVELLASLPTEVASDASIAAFFGALRQPAAEGSLSAAASAQAARACMGRMTPGQTERLQHALMALIDHSWAPAGSRYMAALLEEITGVPMPATGRPSPVKREEARARLRAWARDPANARRYLAGGLGPAYDVEIYDLWIRGKGAGAERLGAAQGRIAAGRPSVVRTSGGRALLLALGPSRPPGRGRIVLHDVYGRASVPEGRLELLTLGSGGRVRYLEISDRAPRPHTRPPANADRYLLAVVVRRAEGPPREPLVPDRGWTRAVEDLVEALPRLPVGERASALRVVTTLRATEAAPQIEAILERTGDPNYAYALLELGSAKAAAFLRGELASPAEDRRLRAARALAVAGDPRGVQALIDALDTVTASRRGLAATALRRAFEAGALTAADQARIVGALVERLDASNASAILPVLRRIAGVDVIPAHAALVSSAQARLREIAAWKRWWSAQAQAR